MLKMVMIHFEEHNLSAHACARTTGQHHPGPRMLMHKESLRRSRVAAAFLQTAVEINLT